MPGKTLEKYSDWGLLTLPTVGPGRLAVDERSGK